MVVFPNEIRAYDAQALRRQTDGLSGSSLIGVPPITGLSAQADNVEQAIKELAAQGAPPSASETQAGVVELATAAETQAGTDNTRAVHPAGLKSELDRRAPASDAYAELTLSVVQSIPSDGATHAVLWDAETRDPSGWHDPTTNPERVTPGVAGMYLATFFSEWAGNTTGIRRARLLRFDGTTTSVVAQASRPTTSHGPGPQTLTTLVYSGATDYLFVDVLQDTGAPLNLLARSTLTVSRVV